MHEWLIIALPVVFLLGWAAARLDLRHVRRSFSQLPEAYLRGVAHLLSHNEDKALDAFLESSKAEDTPVELSFTVGELSRRRGFHDRALHIHIGLYEKEELPVGTRHRALFHLAVDYFYMGFFDLSEKHIKPLLKDKDYGEAASNLLIDLYQRQRRYDCALAVVEALGLEGMVLRRKVAAHLYCQCAEQLPIDKPAKKVQLLKNALEVNGACVRASLMLAHLAMDADPPRLDDAESYLLSVEKQDAEYLWCAVRPLVRVLGKVRARAELLRWLDNYPSSLLFREVYDSLPAESVEEGLSKRFLQMHGGAVAASYWLQEKQEKSPISDTSAWMKVSQILWQAKGKTFTCRQCGYESDAFSWQCRGCTQWESLTQR